MPLPRRDGACLVALTILGTASFAAAPSRVQVTDSRKVHVDSRRLQDSLEKLSEFGRNPEGGVTRIVRTAKGWRYAFGQASLSLPPSP